MLATFPPAYEQEGGENMKRYRKASECMAKVTEYAPVVGEKPVYYGGVYRLVQYLNTPTPHWELYKCTLIPEDMGDVETGPMMSVSLSPPRIVAEGIGEPEVTDDWLDNAE